MSLNKENSDEKAGNDKDEEDEDMPHLPELTKSESKMYDLHKTKLAPMNLKKRGSKK